jgi:hypothetical protein
MIHVNVEVFLRTGAEGAAVRGRPHFGQATASVLICVSQSGHLTRAIAFSGSC